MSGPCTQLALSTTVLVSLVVGTSPMSVVEEWVKLTKTEGNRMVIYEWTLYSTCTFHDSLGQFTCRPRPRICVRRVNETALCWGFVAVFHLPLVGHFSHLSWARQQQPQEQRYPCLTECTIFFCSYCRMAASAWNFWCWCMQLHMGCTKTQLGEKSLAAPGSPCMAFGSITPPAEPHPACPVYSFW